MNTLSAKLSYVFLSGQCNPNSKYIELHNRVYIYWKAFWNEILSQLGSHENLAADDFVRQDLIPVILSGDEIVAVHLYNIFNLQSLAAKEHHYISSNFPESFLDIVCARSGPLVMSMEYLTIDKNWRKSNIGISLAEVLLGLGLKASTLMGPATCIAPARNDLKMSTMSYGLGFECIIPNVLKHNVSCDLVACFQNTIKDSPNKNVNDLISILWAKKKDLRFENQEQFITNAA